jgi:hypothetical protein
MVIVNLGRAGKMSVLNSGHFRGRQTEIADTFLTDHRSPKRIILYDIRIVDSDGAAPETISCKHDMKRVEYPIYNLQYYLIHAWTDDRWLPKRGLD